MSENINEQIECCDCNEIHEDLLKIVNDTMPEETELYDLAELFKVFGDADGHVRTIIAQGREHIEE